MDRLTLNQKIWQAQTEDLLKRIEQLQANKINIETSIIPKRPQYISNKKLKELGKIQARIEALERDVELKNVRMPVQQKDKVKLTTVSGELELKSTGKEYLPQAHILVMNWVMDNISKSPTAGGYMLREFIQHLQDQYGYMGTASILYQANINGINITQEILYDSDGQQTSQYIAEITEFLKDNEFYEQHKEFMRNLFEEFSSQNWYDIDGNEN